jgi:hypothetical protein
MKNQGEQCRKHHITQEQGATELPTVDVATHDRTRPTPATDRCARRAS